MAKKDNTSPAMAKDNHDSESYLDTAESAASPGGSEATELEINRLVDIEVPAPVATQVPEFDPYDPANLRIDQTNQVVAKKLLLTVKVKKPGKQEWFRVNPDPAYRLNVALFQEEGDSIEKEVFLILPSARASLHDNEYTLSTLYLYITSQGNPGIWPVRQPDGRKNDWLSTSVQAVEYAMKGWTRIAANMAGKTNDVFEAVGSFPDPVWPDKSMRELIHIAFKDHVIMDGDHPMVRKLRAPVL